MTSTAGKHPWIFVRHHPLVPAAVFLLTGMALGRGWEWPAIVSVTAAMVCFIVWVLAEAMLEATLRTWVAYVARRGYGRYGGGGWGINQSQVESTHIARFTSEDGEVPVTLHASVVVPPAAGAGRHGNAYFTIEGTALLTEQGWVKATGLAQVKWRAGATAPELHRGDALTVYGWLARPAGALNPGGMDLRRRLAADRIFAEVRVPRSAGIVVAERAEMPAEDWLRNARSFLRARLLQHTVNLDADAANTMVALLLGQRDASIDDVSRAFADAGVAHLLAISGAHVVFLAWVVWIVLRFVPMRPQRREVVCAGIVLAYVLATPCGPPVMRAAIVVVMVLISRLMRRPPTYMNMLAAAAICIVIVRPADFLDAGFQLTFVCTAALLLMAERVHAALFARSIARAAFLADLADTRWARIKLWVRKFVCGAVTANLVGTVASVPLVLFHFQQVTLYGVVTGLIAFPVVAFVMMLSLVQLALEVVWSGAGAAFASVSTFFSHWMVWLVAHLSAIPGAAIALCAPPAWVILLLYLPLVLWILRRRIRVSRTLVINCVVACFVVTGAVYAANSSGSVLQLQVLSVGQGSSVVLTAPNGETVLVNAGSRDLPDIVPTAIGPALRSDGVRRLNTMMVTGMDAVHAKNAAEVVGRYRVKRLLVPPDDGTTTFARMSLEDAVVKSEAKVETMAAGDLVMLGREARMRVLWPVSGKSPGATVIAMVEYAGRRVLLMDPANVAGLALLANGGEDLRCDAVVCLDRIGGTAMRLCWSSCVERARGRLSSLGKVRGHR